MKIRINRVQLNKTLNLVVVPEDHLHDGDDIRSAKRSVYCSGDKKYQFKLGRSRKFINVINNKTKQQFNLIGHEYIVCSMTYYEKIECLVSSDMHSTIFWNLKDIKNPILFKKDGETNLVFSNCYRFLINRSGFIIDLKAIQAIKELKELIEHQYKKIDAMQNKFVSIVHSLALMKYNY